jgi:glycosyltransferase involved in cell wall biosynthesis
VDAAIVRYFRAERSGVLITTRPALNLLSAGWAPKGLIRIGQDHMNLGTYKPALRDALVAAYPRLDAVTVLTEQDLADYRAALGGGVRVARIPNGIPPFPDRPAVPEGKVLVAAGRLAPQKGFDLLIDAYAKVHARHPDWRLDIFGHGDLQPDLEARIAAHGLTGAARLRGVTARLPEELSAAGMFVLSSRFEGLPMVLLEAMTLGVPAVAFDCPTGPAEIIENGSNGLLIRPQDTGALADGICELIERPELRARMRIAARESSARYSMPAVRDLWEELFRDLAAQRG